MSREKEKESEKINKESIEGLEKEKNGWEGEREKKSKGRLTEWWTDVVIHKCLESGSVLTRELSWSDARLTPARGRARCQCRRRPWWIQGGGRGRQTCRRRRPSLLPAASTPARTSRLCGPVPPPCVSGKKDGNGTRQVRAGHSVTSTSGQFGNRAPRSTVSLAARKNRFQEPIQFHPFAPKIFLRGNECLAVKDVDFYLLKMVCKR